MNCQLIMQNQHKKKCFGEKNIGDITHLYAQIAFLQASFVESKWIFVELQHRNEEIFVGVETPWGRITQFRAPHHQITVLLHGTQIFRGIEACFRRRNAQRGNTQPCCNCGYTKQGPIILQLEGHNPCPRYILCKLYAKKKIYSLKNPRNCDEKIGQRQYETICCNIQLQWCTSAVHILMLISWETLNFEAGYLAPDQMSSFYTKFQNCRYRRG